MQENLLMSIKTKHATRIFNGNKIYEFRRKSIKQENLNKKIFIYSSETTKEILGYMIVDKILENDIDSLLKETQYEDTKSIREYFKGCKTCYALHISETYRFVSPIKIEKIKKEHTDFVIPQFYRYIKPNESIYEKLMNRNVIHEMKLQPEYFGYISSGSKRIELRLNDEKRQRIKINDQIIFLNEKTKDKLITHVNKIHKEKSFVELFKNFDISLLASKNKTKEELLNELSKFYTKEKQEKYGVLGIQIEPMFLISSNLNEKIIDEIYELTKEIRNTYSDYKEWFYNKQTKEENRKTIYLKTDEIIGVVNLKKEENKLCTIYLKEEYRNKGISNILLEEAFKYLDTTKPYLTCNKNNLKYLNNIIKKYNWKKTGIINSEIEFNKEK